MLNNLDTATIKQSSVRLVISGKTYEMYHYERPYFYNFPAYKKISGSFHSHSSAQPERRRDNLAVARQKIRRIINANNNQYGEKTKFITYTFKENIKDLKKANKIWTEYCKKFKYRYGKIKYVAVVEFQKRGAIHYHVLYFNLPYIKDIKEKVGKLWGKGFVNIKTIDQVKNIGAYVCKYLQKEIMDRRLAGEKAFFTSRNLFQPYEIRSPQNVATFLQGAIISEEYAKTYSSSSYGEINYQIGVIE